MTRASCLAKVLESLKCIKLKVSRSKTDFLYYFLFAEKAQDIFIFLSYSLMGWAVPCAGRALYSRAARKVPWGIQHPASLQRPHPHKWRF